VWREKRTYGTADTFGDGSTLATLRRRIPTSKGSFTSCRRRARDERNRKKVNQPMEWLLRDGDGLMNGVTLSYNGYNSLTHIYLFYNSFAQKCTTRLRTNILATKIPSVRTRLLIIVDYYSPHDYKIWLLLLRCLIY
jgi:hypothetical protein